MSQTTTFPLDSAELSKAISPEQRDAAARNIIAVDVRSLGLEDFAVERKRIGIALSGGADSVALLHAGRLLNWQMTALHCNFHLRGAESDRDQHSVENICRRLKIPLEVKHFDMSKLQEKGESTEMAARRVRYAWFDRCVAEFGLDAVAVGHNRDDNVETFLMNTGRSSGLGGLKGIPPRSGSYIRPLLLRSKQGIYVWLRLMDEQYVEDSTNATDAYLRNRMRNGVIPELERAYPGWTAGASASISMLRGEYELLNALVAEKRRAYTDEAGYLRVAALAEAEVHADTLMFHILKGALNISEVKDILANPRRSGKRFAGKGDTDFLLNRGMLVAVAKAPGLQNALESVDIYLRELMDELEKAGAPYGMVERPVGDGLTLRFRLGSFKPERDARRIWLDAEALLGAVDTLKVRAPRRGDRMHPFGMKGTRLLSDIFSDAKLSLEQKHHAKVLEAGTEIIWAVGLRAGAAYAVGERTQRILEINI